MINRKDVLLSMALNALINANWYMLGTMTKEQFAEDKTLADIGYIIQAIKKELANE